MLIQEFIFFFSSVGSRSRTKLTRLPATGYILTWLWPPRDWTSITLRMLGTMASDLDSAEEILSTHFPRPLSAEVAVARARPRLLCTMHAWPRRLLLWPRTARPDSSSILPKPATALRSCISTAMRPRPLLVRGRTRRHTTLISALWCHSEQGRRW